MSLDKTTAQNKIDHLIISGYEVRTSAYFDEAMNILKKDIGTFILFTLVNLLIQSAAGSFGLALLISGPLSVGYCIASRRLKNNQTIDFSTFFEGFNTHFAQLLLVSLIGGIFTVLGILLCVLPGIYLAVGYTFAALLVYFCNYEFWEALETSRLLVGRQWFDVFVFLIVIALINLAGVLVCGVGLLVTVPLTSIMIYLAFEDIVLNAPDYPSTTDLLEI